MKKHSKLRVLTNVEPIDSDEALEKVTGGDDLDHLEIDFGPVTTLAADAVSLGAATYVKMAGKIYHL